MTSKLYEPNISKKSKNEKGPIVFSFIIINILLIIFPIFLLKNISANQIDNTKDQVEGYYQYQKDLLKNKDTDSIKSDNFMEMEIKEVKLDNVDFYENDTLIPLSYEAYIGIIDKKKDFVAQAERPWHFSSFTHIKDNNYIIINYKNTHLERNEKLFKYLTNFVILASFGITSIIFLILHSKRNKINQTILQLKKDVESKQGEVRALTKHITKTQEIEQLRSEKDMVERELEDKISYTNHLSNVICGINHEVSPWLGGIENIAIRLRNAINTENIIKDKLNKIIYACDQSQNVLKMLSQDIKTLQEYGVVETNLKETIMSWTKVALMDRFIKDYVDKRNIIIEENSLNFTVRHSPMLLSQVVLNLFTNSVEHNIDKVEDLLITIRGDRKNKMIIYEDNGVGIPFNRLKDIFSAGITSKDDDPGQHGFGLSSCVQYCYSMGALIWAEEKEDGAMFCIKFEEDPHQRTTQVQNISTTKREIRKKISEDLVEEIEKQRRIGQITAGRKTINPDRRKDIDS